MKGIGKRIQLRRAFSTEESSMRRPQSFSAGDGLQQTKFRSDKMSLYGTSSSSSGSTSNLYRSQSMASLTGGSMVLGESFRNSYTLRTHRAAVLKELGLNAKSLSRVPKHPRPKRTMDVFNAVIKGLRDNIKATENDYNQADDDYRLRTSGSHSQKLKTIERHKKKLEYLLSKIEELQDHYQVQSQMREGTKALSKAYEKSFGQHKRDSLLNVHYGYKECSKTMCAIEAQLESMLGQFHCEMKGIMGFARVMPGDSFEVSIRHGNQKWKSKGYVSKDNEQKWDQEKKTLGVQINSSLTVKVFESKRLSKSSLGEKHCDIIGLFAANPQILTVNVNDIGTIKLNILVQWIPLANFTDQMKFYDPPPKETVSPRPLSVIVSSPSGTPNLSLNRPHRKSPRSPEILSPMSRPDLLCDMKDDAKGNVRTLADAIDEEEDEDAYEWPLNLERAVQKLRDALSDYQEHSSTLKSLYDLVNELDSILGYPPKRPLRKDLSEPVNMTEKLSDVHRRHSSISLAIESAFDFLYCEDYESDSDETSHHPVLSPTSTARSTADSGIESLLVNENTLTRSVTPPIYSSGNDDLDTVILQHSALAEVLLENLDNVGMLKSKERTALISLRQQKKIFTHIVALVKRLNENIESQLNVKQILTEIVPHHHDAHEFWLSNAKLECVYMTVSEFSKALHQSFHKSLEEQYEVSSDKVFNAILKRISQAARFPQVHQRNVSISVYQFIYTLLESKCKSLEFYVHEIASEIWLVNQLKSGDTAVMVRSIKSLRGSVPSFDVIKALLVLFTSPTPEICHEVGEFWASISFDKSCKESIIPSLMACLEESRSDIRIGACLSLSRLRATAVTEELMYVAQADSSRRVQAAARNAITSLNEAMGSSTLKR